jgi:quinol monooxygenase YgiN
MISFIVRMRFDENDLAKVAEALRNVTAASRQEPGCVSYVPHFVESQPSEVLIYEQYADEAAVKFHRETPHFQQWVSGGLYQWMRERNVEQLTAVA